VKHVLALDHGTTGLRLLRLLVFAAVSSAWGQQNARSVEGMSEAQRTDYRKLMRGYLDTFRVLGRSKICGLNFDSEPFFREVARRHGEKSEEARIAGLAYTAGAENLMLSQEIDPTPPAPMPCDVMVYMRGMRLPDLPPSLVRRGD
jgi:hypothetical protein